MTYQPPIIKKLPKMKVREVIQLWLNCVSYLAEPTKQKQHGQARLIVNAINQEWLRRGKQPPQEDDYFDWPSTEARGGSGHIDTDTWLQEGVLKVMGYKVGNNDGLAQNMRQKILSEVFIAVIPPIFPCAHLAEWGNPESAQRLKKMAEAIASFTRNARRRGSHMGAAIAHWELDLEFLYWEYYVEKFHFAWPTTQVA